MMSGFPEKIALQVAEAAKHPQEVPLLVYTDLKVVDENLNVQHESMIRTQSDHANTELIQELTENTVTGGVAMINHALADLWTGQEKHALLMHDWYLALLATSFGKLIYIDQPTELYRQHSSNVLGARTLRKRVKTGFALIFCLLSIGISSSPVKNKQKIYWICQSAPKIKKLLKTL